MYGGEYPDEKKNQIQMDVEKILKKIDDFEKHPDTLDAVYKLKSQYIELNLKNMELEKSLQEFDDSRNRMYYDLYQSSPLGYYSLDKDGKIKSVNNTGVRMLGTNKENIVDSNFNKFVAPHFKNMFKFTLLTAANNHENQKCELNIIQNKDTLFTQLEIIPIFDEIENIKEFNVILIDISEHKKLESKLNYRYDDLKEKMDARVSELLLVNESLEKIIAKNELSDKKLRASEKREQARSEEFARVLDAVPAAVWISHDKDGLWITGNQLSYDYLDIPQGANASKSLPPQEAPQSFKIFKDGKEMEPGEMPVQASSAGKEIRNYEFDLIYPEKEVRHLMGNATPLYDEEGKPRGSVSAFMDVTKRKKAEMQMASLLKELERSNRELEQFAYVTSHDLKEPLRMISSFTKLLEQKFKGQLDEDADNYINYIVDGTKRMQRLLDDLLAYSRISNEVKYEPLKLTEIVNESIHNLKVAIDENQAEITVDPLPEVVANRTQMIQLFQNLIANAIKFQSKKKPVIHVSCEESGNKYYFSVQDNGIGIDSKNLDRVFKMFQRLHTADEYDGTGIGLSITKKIVQQHSGAVWVESKLDEGSTFYFSIPIDEQKV
ncbi:PAS/PAC sensor signal transduction histidine kinase [Methanobacterium lacus]|uniref:histidine kinase n=1 Tax=Methanobacterium lacus (strain AL-21) TaxID=877455 RepID=F0TCL9_METLA|nr:ATP-binding protein [Methanobacterium lacus]ADZ09296.1 PAS/PAC sensor signal transduction histidine kinase [Methanobacterium lacus]